MNYDWSDLAFSSKKELRKLHGIFIAAPRNISSARFTQLVKTYLPQGNIVLGLAKENFIDGFDGQPQFATLQAATMRPIISKVNGAKTAHKIYTLQYFQRELPFLLQKIAFKKVLFVRGSWHKSFHLRPEYYLVANKKIPYELVSPFSSEDEAKMYAETQALLELQQFGLFTESEMLKLASRAATHSFDGSYQTGVALGKKHGKKYDLLATAFNGVVPYQTYAWHFGAARETHFSPPHDLNHYDTVHAEVNLVIKAQQECINLNDATLFINLLPCPACARMFARTDIAEFVYTADHSEGYAIKILESAGKKVRRLVS